MSKSIDESIFNIVKKHKRWWSPDVDEKGRLALFRNLKENNAKFRITSSDLVSLDGKNAEIEFTDHNNPLDKGGIYSKAIVIKRNRGNIVEISSTDIYLDVIGPLEFEVLKHDSFAIKALVRVSGNDSVNKIHFITMVIVNGYHDPEYVFSFSLEKSNDACRGNKKWINTVSTLGLNSSSCAGHHCYERKTVFESHSGSGTGGSGRH